MSDSTLRQAIESKIKPLDVLGTLGLEFKRKGDSDEFGHNCQFHNEENASCYLNSVKGLFHCFACGESGNWIKIVAKMLGCEYKGALLYLKNLAGIEDSGKRTYGGGNTVSQEFPTTRQPKVEAVPVRFTLNEIVLARLDTPIKKPVVYRCNNIYGETVIPDKKYSAKKEMEQGTRIQYAYSQTKEYFNFTKPDSYPAAFEKRIEYFDSEDNRITKQTRPWVITKEGAKAINKLDGLIEKATIMASGFYDWTGKVEGKSILVGEGIDCLQDYTNLDFVATAFISGTKSDETKKRFIRTAKEEKIKVLIQIIDYDSAGENDAAKFEKFCNELEQAYLPLKMSDLFPPDYPIAKGADLKDYLKYLRETEGELTKRLVERKIFAGIAKAFERRKPIFAKTNPKKVTVQPRKTFADYKETIRIKERYLPSLDAYDIKDSSIIFINSSIGTNKTGTIKDFLDIHGAGLPVIMPTLRKSLKESLGKRFDIFTGDKWVSSEEINRIGLCDCTDSMHSKTNKYEWDMEKLKEGSRNLVIDECTQVFAHMLLANTAVAKHRPEVLANIIIMIRSTIVQGGKVFFADAHLTPEFIDLIKALTADLTYNFTIIDNHFQPHKGKRKCYVNMDKTPFKLLQLAVEAVLRGERIYLYTVGQKEKSLCGTINVESWLIKMGIPESWICRIDRESIGDKNHVAFQITKDLSKLNDFKIVIASPTMETGVDLAASEHHFDKVIGISYGLTSVTSFLQGMGRPRCDAELHFWTPKVAKGRGCLFGNGETTFTEMKRSQSKELKSARDSLKAFARKQAANLDTEVDDLFAYGSDPETTAAILNDYRNKICTLHNVSQQDYRANVIKLLERDGYEICELDLTTKEELAATKEALIETRDINVTTYREKVTEAVVIDEYEFEQRQMRDTITKKEQYECDKYLITKNTGVTEFTTELFEIVDNGLSYLQNVFYVKQKDKGIEIAQQQDFMTFENIKNKRIFNFDLIKRFKTPKFEEIITRLDLDKFIDPNLVFTSEDAKVYIEEVVIPRVSEFGFGISKTAREIKEVVFNEKMKPISKVQAIVNLVFGRRLERKGRITVNKKRLYCFQGISLSNLERQILRNWHHAHKERLVPFNEALEEIKDIASMLEVTAQEKNDSDRLTMLQTVFGTAKQEVIMSAIAYVGKGLKDLTQNLISSFLNQPGYVFV